VPYSTLVYVFGKNEMFWYRAEKTFSHGSIVGTTVKKKDELPEDVLFDEKHSKINGVKTFIAMTAAKGCVLGAEPCSAANETELKKGYSVFANECANIDPEYSPKTGNTDGWGATSNAIKSLFIKIVIIRCFLHTFIKIRDCCKKHPKSQNIFDRVWTIYHAANKKSFSQRLRQFKNWAEKNIDESPVLEKIRTMHGRCKEFTLAYDHPGCHRTSNLCDRLMKFLDRSLFSRQNFHGTFLFTQKMTHAWAILHNFYPYCLRKTNNDGKALSCPASELNGFFYAHNWLHNLMISSSMNGYRR
jgi:hypothetical protein